jgi:protein gp37
MPLSWKKPRLIFVNSMSDLFHDEIPLDFVQSVFDVMEKAHWHQFQLLTKRPERMLELSQQLDRWPSNVWAGVSVESQAWTWRYDVLKQIPAQIRFLSCEPLIGRLHLDLQGINWVIVGGESGPGSRPMKIEWVREIRDQCLSSGVPFFFKQWGGVQKKKNGRTLDGRTWDDFPSLHEDKPLCVKSS